MSGNTSPCRMSVLGLSRVCLAGGTDASGRRARAAPGGVGRRRAAAARCLVATSLLVSPALAVALEVKTFRTPAGTTVHLASMPAATRVDIRLAWPSDWAHDGEPIAAPQLGSALLQEDAAPVGLDAAFGLSPTSDHVRGYLNASGADLDAAVARVADALAAPLFEERRVRRARADYLARIESLRTQPAARVADLATRLALGDGAPVPYILQTDPQAIRTTTRADLVRWHARNLVREGVRVAVAGDLDRDAAGEAVDALLAALPDGERSRSRSPARRPSPALGDSARLVVLHDPDVATSRFVMLGGSLPPPGDAGEQDDLAALELLANGGARSMLQTAMRAGLHRSGDLAASADVETGTFRPLVVFGDLDTDRIAEARASLRETYARFVADGPDFTTFASQRHAHAERVAAASGQVDAVATAMLGFALAGHPPARVARLAAGIDAVTPESVTRRLAEVWPRVDELLEVYLTPDADAFLGTGACVVDAIDWFEDQVERCRRTRVGRR